MVSEYNDNDNLKTGRKNSTSKCLQATQRLKLPMELAAKCSVNKVQLAARKLQD
jgi:hypothetical protein